MMWEFPEIILEIMVITEEKKLLARRLVIQHFPDFVD